MRHSTKTTICFECIYAVCRVLSIGMLSVVMLNVDMPNVDTLRRGVVYAAPRLSTQRHPA